MLAAQIAQRRERRDRAYLAGIGCEAHESARSFERGLQERSAGDAPHFAGPCHEPAPVIAGAAPELIAHRPRDTPGVDPGHLEGGSVGEAVAKRGIEGLDVDGVLQGAAGLQEQVAVDGWQREQAGPGIEDEAVALVARELAAGSRRLLEDGDVVAFDLEAHGRRHAAHSGSDDDDSCHSVSVGRQLRAARIAAAMPTGAKIQPQRTAAATTGSR